MPKRAAAILTDTACRSARPKAGGDIRLRDGSCPGLSLRVRPAGSRAFVLDVTRAGKRISDLAIGDYDPAPPRSRADLGARSAALLALKPWEVAPFGITLAEARARAERIRAFVRAGGDPVEERQAARAAEVAERVAAQRDADGISPAGSLGDLAQRWLDYQRREGRSTAAIRAAELALERDVLPHLRNRQAGEVTRAELAKIAEGIAEGRGARRKRPGQPAPVAARNTVKLLSRIYAYGLDIDFPGVAGDPAARLARRHGSAARRDRVLSPGELRAFWRATGEQPPALRAFARLLLLTGLRRDELLGARWDEIVRDEAGTWLAIPGLRMKGGKPHAAPLSRLALSELALLSQFREGEVLFPGRSGGDAPMREAFYYRKRLAVRVADLLDVPSPDPRPWTWHDLRRTARTILAAAGADEVPAELLLAHVPPALRGVAGAYNRHRYRAELQAVAELLAERVAQAVEEEIAAPAVGEVLPFTRRA
ncbi:MAG: integrase family protein [Holophagales bacterium]|nr:MAG: integrase family protein [Holophagales bacterium]